MEEIADSLTEFPSASCNAKLETSGERYQNNLVLMLETTTYLLLLQF
jgi:hypothetical protein